MILVTLSLSILWAVIFLAETQAQTVLPPCDCQHMKHLERNILDDEYLAREYEAKWQELKREKAKWINDANDTQKKNGANRSAEWLENRYRNYGDRSTTFVEWKTIGLRQKFMKDRGYEDAITVSPDDTGTRLHADDMEKLRKNLKCREEEEGALIHERVHFAAHAERLKEFEGTLDAGSKEDLVNHILWKMIDKRGRGNNGFIAVVEEELAAYEAGVQYLREVLRRLREDCKLMEFELKATVGQPPARIGLLKATLTAEDDSKYVGSGTGQVEVFPIGPCESEVTPKSWPTNVHLTISTESDLQSDPTIKVTIEQWGSGTTVVRCSGWHVTTIPSDFGPVSIEDWQYFQNQPELAEKHCIVASSRFDMVLRRVGKTIGAGTSETLAEKPPVRVETYPQCVPGTPTGIDVSRHYVEATVR